MDRLLVAIVSGTYPPGSRLPPERDLAPSLGASRATLREAFRQLDGMHLISARRGSGVTVRPLRDWSIEVLPLYLAAGAPYSAGGVVELAKEMMTLRRELVLTMLRMIAPRLAPGALANARALAAHAWDAHEDLGEFSTREMAALQEVGAAAQVLPTQWLLNTLTSVYVRCAKLMPGPASVPKDYLDVFLATAAALEAQDATRACALMGAYYERSDDAFFRRMEEAG